MTASGERKDSARRYVLRKMQEKGWDAPRLVIEAGIDDGTARAFLRGTRYPNRPTRAAIEKALGLAVGSIEGATLGLHDEEPEQVAGDPVEDAIYRSRLTRANQLKLAGLYYEMLESQDAGEVRNA